MGHPAILVTYRFSGFLDDIYATLVVRLHHTEAFEHDKLWRYAADFQTVGGKQLGIKLTRRAEGAGELDVYFDPQIADEQKIIFARYVHEHLGEKAQEVVRLRHYVCGHCGTAVGNREVAMDKLNAWLAGKKANAAAVGRGRRGASGGKIPSVVCIRCEKRVPLWDDLERRFASEEVRRRVSELEGESAAGLDNESKERVLVGEVISTVALARQIWREVPVNEHGVGMEIEFRRDDGDASGRKVYLWLKLGGSYLRDFAVGEGRHVRYWMDQAFPVMLVMRSSKGEIRWMEVGDWLKSAREGVKQIAFRGERFDVMSVRKWRERGLGR